MGCVWLAGDIKLLQNYFRCMDTRQHMHSLSVMEVRFTVYAFMSVVCAVNYVTKMSMILGRLCMLQ